MQIKFDTEIIKMMNLFEVVANVQVRDCLIDNDVVYVVVGEGEIRKAIGKNGSVVRSVERLIKKQVKIFEFSRDPLVFVKNLVPDAREIRLKTEADRVVAEIRVDKSSKPMVIGREGRKIKIVKELLKRNHGISDLVVR